MLDRDPPPAGQQDRRREAQRRRRRRYRQRQRAGMAVLRIEVPINVLTDALIEAQRLTPEDGLRRERVEEEAVVVLLDWCERWEAD
jgi:hypothetical protein